MNTCTCRAQDTLSPDCRREKTHHKYNKEYSDDGLSGYTVSSLKAVGHRYNSLCVYGELGFLPPAVRA